MDLVQRLAARREVWAQNRPLATAPEPIAPTPAVVAAPASQPQNPEQKKS